MRVGRFFDGPAAALAVVMVVGLSGAVQAQTPETVSRVIEALNFSGGYENRLDALIAQMKDRPRVWRNDAAPAEVRADMLRLQPQVEARLRARISIKYTEDELLGVLAVLDQGGDLDTAQPEMAYSLNFEFDSAISDFMLPIIRR